MASSNVKEINMESPCDLHFLNKFWHESKKRNANESAVKSVYTDLT